MSRKKKSRVVKPRRVRQSVQKVPILKNLGQVGRYHFVLLPGPNTQVGSFSWVCFPNGLGAGSVKVSDVLDSVMTLEDLCKSNSVQAQDFGACHVQALAALGTQPEVLLGAHPRNRDFVALAEAIAVSSAELEYCVQNGLLNFEDDELAFLRWCVECLEETGKCCGTYEHLNAVLEGEHDEELAEFTSWLEYEQDPQAALSALVDETDSFLAEIFTYFENGHHHLTLTTMGDDYEVLAVDKEDDIVTLPEDMEDFTKKLCIAYALGGALVVRSLTGQLHADGVTKLAKICSYRLGDEEIVPIDAAHMFDAHNTDVFTGDILAPEHGVEYVDAWELEKYWVEDGKDFDLIDDESTSIGRLLASRGVSDLCMGWLPESQWEEAHKIMPEYLEQFDHSRVYYNEVLQSHMEDIAFDALEYNTPVNIIIVPLVMDDYVQWCNEEGVSPDSSSARATFAVSQQGSDFTISWPPSGPLAKCWCGSSKLYTSCCATE